MDSAKIRELKAETGYWVLCPICNNKTRIKVRPDTVLENFPLFCPKCKQKTIINVTGQNVVAIKTSESK